MRSAPPASGRRRIKQRRTFTLSQESIALLEELSSSRGEAAPGSVSAVLDQLLLSVRREKQRQETEQKIRKYYDALSPDEEKDDTAWGKFALANFPADDTEEGLQ